MDYEYDPMFDQEPKQENTAAGILGALLGSLAGVVCIILISRLNYVASVSGLVMAVCALKGYEKLAGTLSKKGVAISCVIIVIMTYLAHHLNITIELMLEADLSFLEAFSLVPRLMRFDGAYFWGNLAMLYLFTLLGAIPTIRNSMIKPVPAPQYFPVQNPPAGGMQPGPMGNLPAAGAGNMPAAQAPYGMPAPPAGYGQTVRPGSVPTAPTGNAPAAPMGTAQPVLPGGIPAASAQTAFEQGAGIYAAQAENAQAAFGQRAGMYTAQTENAQAAFGQNANMYAAPAQGAQAFPPQNAQAPAAIEFFPPDRHMTAKPRYGGLGLALFYFITGFALFVGGAVTDTPYVTPVLGGLVLIICAFFPYIGAFTYVPDTMLLFARVNGTLWRINLEQLNKQPGYRFTDHAITLTGVRWHKLSPAEQQRAMLSVQYLIAAIETAQVESSHIESTRNDPFASPDMLIATPLPEAVLLKETQWAWKISYVASNGKRRKLTIHKSYPGFAPVPGCRPAERPVPFGWRSAVISLIFALLFGGLFLAVDFL